MRSHAKCEAISGQSPPVLEGVGGYVSKHYFHAFLDRAGSQPILLIDHPDGAIEIEGLDQMRALRTTVDHAIRLAKAAAAPPSPFWRRRSI